MLIKPRPIQRIRHELRLRELTVASTENLSGRFIRIHFSGEDLNHFVSSSFDDHVKLFFYDGNQEQRRDYTPRSFDTEGRRLTVDFALHEAGAATAWARQTRTGDTLRIGGPRGSMVIADDFDWHLLVGDASAMPAIARRVEELPANCRIAVITTVAAADYPIPAHPGLYSQHADNDAQLLTLLSQLTLPSGDGFAWAAGEAQLMKQVRNILQNEKQLSHEQIKVAAYWKQGSTEFHEVLE